MKDTYEYIVIGCGGIGSATVYWLARRAGSDVLGLEQFQLGHDRGGSQDHSRIIRLSYDAPAYTALAPYAYATWQAVEAESGVQLVLKTGGLDFGPGEGAGAESLDRHADAMRRQGIPFDGLTAGEIMGRWPQFHLDATDRGLYQADGGLVDAGKANAVHARLAQAHGATILENAGVRQIRPLEDGVEVETEAGAFACRRLVVAAGAWTNQVLQSVGVELPLTVTQEQVTYFATPNLRAFAPDRFPIWIFHGDTYYYGFPVYGEVATKAAEDLGGEEVTADTRTFEPNQRNFEGVHQFLEKYIPGSLGPVLYTKTCLYTLPPDRNFIIDTLPAHPQIAVAVGAGHAFKFAGLIGRILSQLTSDGQTPFPIEAFRIDRPAITDPDFPRAF